MSVNLNPSSINAVGTGQSDLHSRRAEIQNAAKQFEAFFLSYVLKQMQQNTLESGLFGQRLGNSTYNEMFTDELAKVMAEGRGIGLADQLVRQLEAGLIPGGPANTAKPSSGPQPLKSQSPANQSQGLPLQHETYPLKSRVQPLSLQSQSQSLALPAIAPAVDRSLGSDLQLPGPEPVKTLEAAPSAVSAPLDEGSISSGFGLRRDPFTGRPRFHEGIDIAAEQGTPIKSAAEGRVVFSGWQGGYGNTVIVEHASGFRTRYAHAESFSVRAGDFVEAGQILGTVGSTGRSTGPHLHFEVTKDGEHLNPGEIFSLK